MRYAVLPIQREYEHVARHGRGPEDVTNLLRDESGRNGDFLRETRELRSTPRATVRVRHRQEGLLDVVCDENRLRPRELGV